MLEEAKDYEMKKPHSFMRQHELEEHNGEEKVFKFKVTHTGQPVLRRQIREAVEIAHAEKTMNGKTEWSLPMQQYSAESNIVRLPFRRRTSFPPSFSPLLSLLFWVGIQLRRK